MKTDVQAFRQIIIGFVESVAVGGTTEKYGGTTPYLDYLEELLCMWFDDLYRSPDRLIEDGVLTTAEVKILNQFNNVLDTAYPKHSEPDVVDINKLQDDPAWLQIMATAKECLKQLGKT